MNVLIIEDEESAFNNLKRILFKIDPTIQILDWLQSVENSIEWFSSNNSPDLIFLDIHLSDDLSFKIFETVKINCPIIFTTAFDEFAIKAFELNSLDYLLKPITEKDINKAIIKYNSTVKPNIHIYEKMISDLANLSTKVSFKERFLVNKGDELIIIPISEIAYFYKENETYIVLKNGSSYPINHTLDKLISLLNPDEFYRINRQIIASVDAISKVSIWFKGKLKIKLTPEFKDTIFVSRTKVTEFKNWMDS